VEWNLKITASKMQGWENGRKFSSNELMFWFCQSNCNRGESFPFSSFGRKSKWSHKERNGDKTDKTLATQYFVINFAYHDSVFSAWSLSPKTEKRSIWPRNFHSVKAMSNR